MDEAEMIAEFVRIFGTGGDHVFGPRPEEAVIAAERELGLTFPRSLRVFFRRFGAAMGVGGVSLNGLPDTRDTDEEMPQFLNVIDQTNSLRESHYGREPRPHEWIDLGSNGGGLHFSIDTARKPPTATRRSWSRGPESPFSRSPRTSSNSPAS